MTVRQRYTIPTTLVVLALFAGAFFLSVDSARSYDKQTKAATIEYKTDSVDADSLQVALDALGKQGWNVFSVTRAELRLEPGANQQTRLISDKYQVTAKRSVRR